MIPRDVEITQQHLIDAGKKLLEEGKPSNATAFEAVIVIDGQEHGFPPKKLISYAFEQATGDKWPVSKFSGGQESHRYLGKFSVNIKKREK